MALDYNTEQFLDHCRMTKPPYECPHPACRRVYRSFSGIQNHMSSFDHDSLPVDTKSANTVRDPSELPPIPLTTELTSFEYVFEGVPLQMSIYDSLEMMSMEQYEASLPPQVEEPPTYETAKTPTVKNGSKPCPPKTPKGRSTDKGVDVQRYTIDDKKTRQLPEAKFHTIEGLYEQMPDAPQLPKTYMRFVEKTPEELDAQVEYDMDEEDMNWLTFVNEEREEERWQPVSTVSFELLMDRLEKESFFQAQCAGKDTGAPIDEDAVCCICMDGECQNSNVILFCDMCNLAVHQECYGVPYIPEGQWLCRRCLQSPSRAVDCVLCPNKGGAFKQTDDSRWGHVVCAMWIPEVCFANTVFLEPIDSIGRIQPARWKLTCYICMQKGVGACIQCNKVNCYTAFHVTCAQQAGLHMKIDAVRETGLNGTSVTVRKAAYCDIHTPADSDAKPQVEEIVDVVKKAAAKAASRQKMKKARKILAEKRSAAPVVSVPTLPAERIQELAKMVEMDGKSHFIHRLLAYWSLKRQSRNGVPLLRRLTSSYSRRNLSPSHSRKKDGKISPRRKSPEGKKEEKSMESVNCLRKLRQCLEKTRILSELVKKREEKKSELLQIHHDCVSLKIAPFNQLLLKSIDKIQEMDTLQIFAEPVDVDEIHDYLDIVEKPMDFSTIRHKAETFQYTSVDGLKEDFELMIENCLAYNSKETVFHKMAVKIRDPGNAIIRQLQRDVHNIGFDMDTGLFSDFRPTPLPVMTEAEIMKEVDATLGSKLKQDETYSDREKYLWDLFDKANTLKHHITRQTRVKLIKKEISVVRRRKALQLGAKSASEEGDTTESEREDSSAADDEAEPGIPNGPNPSQALPESPIEPPQKSGTNIVKKKTKPKSVQDPTEESQEEPSATKEDTDKEEDQPPIEEKEAEKQKLDADPPQVPRKRGRPPKNPSSSPKPVPVEIKLPVVKSDEEEKSEPTDREECSEVKVTEDCTVPAPGSSPTGVNRRTSVLFTKKAGALTKGLKSSLDLIPKHDKVPTLSLDDAASTSKESFQVYRQPGAIAAESDDDTQSESSSSADNSLDDSCSSGDSDGEGSASDSSSANHNDGIDRNQGIPLEPLDLVWAKCRGYPWYPALIINPKMPRTGYFHNRVPIPVPPDEVLAHATNYETPMYLVLFFDQKRTWQWLPRMKLEPLGVNSALDKEKLVESRKPTDRKAVKRAYEKAILHRCKVTGENTGLSEESSDETQA